MKIGCQLPSYGSLATREDITRVATHVEAAGLDSVWVGDHVVFPVASSSPYPYTSDGSFPLGNDGAFLEALMVLSFVAGVTERVMLGTSVLVLPQRNELLAARQLGSLATLAPGRAIAGVGGGWLREEFDALGRSFDARGAVLDEQLVALRGLWTERRYAQHGDHVAFPALHMEPLPPVAPAVWVGGNSAPALRRAGRLADAWHAAGADSAEQLTSSMAVVRAAALEAGRDDARVALTARIGMGRGPRGVEGLTRRLRLLDSLGCAHVMVDSRAEDLDDALWCCDALATVAGELAAG